MAIHFVYVNLFPLSKGGESQREPAHVRERGEKDGKFFLNVLQSIKDPEILMGTNINIKCPCFRRVSVEEYWVRDMLTIPLFL